MAIKFSYNTGLFEIGHYHGAPIYLSPAFFLLGALLAYPFWRMVSMTGLLLAVIFITAAFVSILVHELAHAAVGRRFGMGAERIDINMSGGLVQLRAAHCTMAQDFAITLAGPLSNLALGLAAFGMLALIPAPEPEMILIGNQLVTMPYAVPGIAERALRAIAYLNVGLCIVNLFPGVPLDGGRLVYLLVELRWNSRTALLVVSSLGLVFACVSALVTFATMLAGFPIWAPPEFKLNWEAFQAARQGHGDWDAHTGSQV